MAMRDERPWVAYVGPFGYPDGGAAARRVLGMAESLSLARVAMRPQDSAILSSLAQAPPLQPPSA